MLAAFEGEAVNDEAIDELREKLTALQADLVERRAKADQAKSDEQACTIAAAELRGAVAGETELSIEAALEAAQVAITETESAAAALPALRNELTVLIDQVENHEESITHAREAVTKLTTQLEQLEKRLQEQAEADREVLGDCESAVVLEEVTRNEIEKMDEFRECDERLALAKAGLPALEDDLDVDSWLASVISLHANAISELDEAEQAAGLVVHAAQLFKNPKDQLLSAMVEHQELFYQTAPAIALADAVTANKSSINFRRMTLQSYAVQRRFASVLEAASKHVNRMSGGKYTFELDDLAKGNAQSGLGIKISDSWSGQSRDPRSLSGGETFYAALALALGLADVVRDEAGGTQLETLFVDEGFGSLDQESLQLVLEQLDALRSGGRIVGVVSHVTEMKDWVQDRVEVEVSPDRTSRVRTLL
jgi:exonuclease SbcC